MGTAQATPNNVTGAGVVSPAPCTFRGLSIRDTTGAVNTVTLYDDPAGATGTVVATVVLAANGSGYVAAPDGVRAAKGLYMAATGAVVGSVWTG